MQFKEAEKIISKTKPIMDTVVVSFDSGRIWSYSPSTMCFVSVKVDEMEQQDTSVTIKQDALKKITKLKSINQISLSEEVINVSGSLNLKVATSSNLVEDYPELPTVTKDIGTWTNPKFNLFNYASPKDMARGCLEGIMIQDKNSFATDGHSLKMKYNTHEFKDTLWISDVYKSLIETDTKYELSYSVSKIYDQSKEQTFIKFTNGDVDLYLEHNENELNFPDVYRVIPKTEKLHLANINLSEMLSVCKEILPFANAKTKLIKFHYQKKADTSFGKCKISCLNRDDGTTADKTVSAVVETFPNDYEVGFNGSYLITLLSDLSKAIDKCEYYVSESPVMPSIFKNYEDDSLGLLMPLRIIEEM